MLKHSGFSADESDGPPLMARRQLHNHSEFDITAMIDLVFMMNIYFLVTSLATAAADIDLPAAKNCFAADRDTSIVITILAAKDQNPAGLLVGDEADGEPLTEQHEQQREVLRAVEEAARAQMNTVIIRAEKDVALRDLMRVARTVASVEGVQLKVSVVEKE